MTITLGELASRISARVHGDDQVRVTGLGSLRQAGPGQLTFLADGKLRTLLADSQAAAVICREGDLDDLPLPALVVDDPYLAYASLSHEFDPAEVPVPGISQHARLADNVRLGERVSIGANVVIEADVSLADDVVVMPGCYIGAGSRLGRAVRVWPNVTIYHGVEIAERTTIHAGTVIGSDGFGFAPSQQGWQKIAQVGGVRIGADVSIGANCSIDRGAIDDTLIGNGVIIDNQVHIAHNVVIGEHTAIAAQVGIAGSARIGSHCLFAGQVGVNGHIEICDHVQLLGKAMVTKSITRPGAYASGLPADQQRLWQRRVARFRRIDDLFERVRKLEQDR